MKDRRARRDAARARCARCPRCIFLLLAACIFLYGFGFSTSRLFFPGTFHPVPGTWRAPQTKAVSGQAPRTQIAVRETVIFPDQALIFLQYPTTVSVSPLLGKDDVECAYFVPNASQPHLKLPPLRLDGLRLRCPLVHPRRFSATVALKPTSGGRGVFVAPGPAHVWNKVVYEALIDRDNTTLVFVKGLNLRPERAFDPAKFECVYGWDFTSPRFLLKSEVVSAAQEIVRCRTPLSVLTGRAADVKVSVRVKGRGVIPSIARPERRLEGLMNWKEHEMCICTMLRNQARFLKEWVIYHGRIGVGKWFIYDNNSEDDIEEVVEALEEEGFRISRYLWPWIKTQEAGFAHCAMRARGVCKWVGFIDVDEFFHLPTGLTLHQVLGNRSMHSNVVELRTSCHSFGPSGLKKLPPRGVMDGYTCRRRAPERHKSIVKPEALNSTLINVVHHFHVKAGLRYMNMDPSVMVINHYKYQVWEVFKEKFYRRVATYVADWQAEENVGSKDRAPGLGTRAVEPKDWSSRFCEVIDTGLRDRMLKMFEEPWTRLLPWMEGYGEQAKRRHRRRSRRRKGRG
uniref:Glycosyltransferase family 92 protein n=1 Tax=Kalanchoe fedtschenkoi TaxID=63787 RepID=A0A7N0TRR5_KALFE